MKRCKDILLLSVTGLLVSVAGCDSVIYDNYPVGNDPEDLVTLVLNIGLVAPTRAAANNDGEKMHDLRIVLLDDKGAVEYNEHISFDGLLTEYKEGTQGYQFIRTKPGSKKIFLVANEASVTAVHSTDNSFTGSPSLTTVLNDWPAGSDKGGFETMVKSIYFAPGDYSGMNIPLSSSYEFEIPEEKAGGQVVKEFYLVHAATKFEFEFINNRQFPVQINALSISSIADNMYLMANFGTEAAEKKEVTWEEGSSTQTAYWIDWLKKVSEATNKETNVKDPNNESTNKNYGWIKDYELPGASPNHTDKHLIEGGKLVVNGESVPSDEMIKIPADATTANPYKGVPVTYFPESKNLVSGSAENQQYSFSITLTDTDPDNMIPDGVSKTKEFPNLPLTNIGTNNDNLVTLFRNTHVKITCTIGYDEQDIELTLLVGICPWYEATINIPAFD